MTEAIMRDEIQAQRETDAYRRGKLATAQSIERMLRERASRLRNISHEFKAADEIKWLADQIRKEYGL